MAERPNRESFSYEQIELYKSENLGSGSYGTVCKARCNHLLCAAKIIYTILEGSLSLKNHRSPYQRFEQECQFLRQINHPHIVQYLQTYHDPETGSSVLLMELMDESLTHFLQTSPKPLPFHIRVTISHSVVLALAFLHSNGIIHRDLSSNNILINDGIRAKVTDFGMSMFSNAGGSRTLCPGTVAYMPPESLNEPPVHSDKLDCFSFGACLVQICTRLWPDPKPRFTTYQVQDPRDVTKTVEAQIPVPEIERRSSHIKLIESTDLLRQIALDCLSDEVVDRPSASELCTRIETLKERQEYAESLAESSQLSVTADERLVEVEKKYAKQQKLLESEMQRLRADVEEAHEDLRERNQMFDIRARQLQKVTRSLAEKERENDRLRSSIALEGNSKMVQNEIIEALEKELEENERENTRLHQQLEVQAQTIRDQQFITKNDDYQRRNMQYDLSAKVELLQRLTHQLEQATTVISEKERMFASKKRETRHLEELLQTKMNSFQETLKSREQRIQDLEEYLTNKEEHIAAIQKEYRKLDRVETKEKKKFKPKPTPRWKKDGAVHTYKSDQMAPCKMHAGSTASIGSSVYLRPYDSKEVYEFNSESSHWATLPECPETAFTLASIQGNLTSVGGRGSKKLHCLLKSNGSRKWVESYPEMIDERASSCAVSDRDTVVVAGGLKSDYSTISSVEVFSFRTFSWGMVASLPYPLHSASATICGDMIYLGGGYYMKSRSLYSVLTCSLSSLLSTTADPTQRSASFPRDFRQKDWYHISNLPICRSTFASLHDELVAIGGKNNDGTHSKVIYKYNLPSNSWEEVSHLDIGRSNCLVGILSNKIMVVGGYCDEGISSEIEYITI